VRRHAQVCPTIVDHLFLLGNLMQNPPADSAGAIVRHGVIAVVPRQGRLLVIRRAPQIVAGGMLCFPGGGIEQGETEENALVRELDEELGVAVAPVRPLWKSVTAWRVALTWWLAQIDPAATPLANPAEVAEIHWYSLEELTEVEDLLPSNRDFLAAIRAGKCPGPW
jgi:mutator protein MutT